MGIFGLVAVGIVLILFYKLFFGTDQERKGCWHNVGCCIVSTTVVGLLIAHDLNKDGGAGRPSAPVGGKSFGINAEIANPTICAQYGVMYTGGSLFVMSVVPGSGAQRANLPTSVIVEVDGLAPDSQELTAVKARHKVGDMVPFKLVTPDGRWWNYWVQLDGE